jgi:SET domain-containing protein 6
MQLILVMLYENQLPSSLWREYLGSSPWRLADKDILPENFDTPMFWNDEELTQLKGTEVLPRIGKKKSEEQYTQFLLPLITVSPILTLTKANPELFDPVRCSLHAFHRMGSLILAYSFGSTNSSDDDESESTAEITMVPLADMLNANPQLNNVSLPSFKLT